MDISMRVLANKTEKLLGQPFVILNNGGGGGSVALEIVAKEKTDGYHLAAFSSTGLIRLPQFRTIPYKYEDFVSVMHYGTSQTGLVVRSDFLNIFPCVKKRRQEYGKFEEG